MLNGQLLALHNELQSVLGQQGTILQRSLSEKRDFKPEEKEQYDRMTADADRIQRQIELIQQHEERSRILTQPADDSGVRTKPGQSTPDQTAEDPNRVEDISKFTRENRGEPEYRRSFLHFCRTGQQDGRLVRDLSKIGTGSGEVATGGALAPKWMETDLLVYLQERVWMRNVATVRNSTTDMDIPIASAIPTAVWKAEKAAFAETDPTLANLTMKAYKLTTLIKVTHELLQDSGVDLEMELAAMWNQSFSQAEHKAFLVGAGSGSSEPAGIVGGSSLGKTAAATGAVTTDEVLDLAYSLKEQYWPRAIWGMNMATYAAIRKLKGSDGQYIMLNGNANGLGQAPGSIEGRPIYFASHMDTMAAAKKVILFGDFSFYRIQDRRGLFVQRLNELYAANGQVGFLCYKRTDGQLLVAEAVKHLITAAS